MRGVALSTNPWRDTPLTIAGLQRRQTEIHERHARARVRVGSLLETQRRVGAELSEGLTVLAQQRTEMDAVERRPADGGLFASLLRPLIGRRAALARQSIALGLIERYEYVSGRLREATRFSDDLRLCALELQAEVDGLHDDLEHAIAQERLAAALVLDLERQLEALDRDRHTPDPTRERQRDQWTFELQSAAVSLTLYGHAVGVFRQHLEPARALRDTVLRLYQDMAGYVLAATQTVNAAGRKITALGALADVPTVVGELQQSLDALGLAIEATTQWIDRSQEFVAHVLPDLSARLRAEAEATEQALAIELRTHQRERTRRAAERALVDAAEDEVAILLGKPDP